MALEESRLCIVWFQREPLKAGRHASNETGIAVEAGPLWIPTAPRFEKHAEEE
jgi:hypothetical protein